AHAGSRGRVLLSHGARPAAARQRLRDGRGDGGGGDAAPRHRDSDSRYEDYAHIGAPHLAADDSCACFFSCAWFFVLGPEAANWRAVDLAAHPVIAYRNGAVAQSGSGANVLGDPRAALAWLANDRARRGDGLRAGEVVTTGTCVKPVAVAPGDPV